MVFLDCTEWCREHGRDIQWLLDEGARVGVGYQDGRPFHGPCHIRVNLALPLSRVREACDRLDRYVFGYRGRTIRVLRIAPVSSMCVGA